MITASTTAALVSLDGNYFVHATCQQFRRHMNVRSDGTRYFVAPPPNTAGKTVMHHASRGTRQPCCAMAVAAPLTGGGGGSRRVLFQALAADHGALQNAWQQPRMAPSRQRDHRHDPVRERRHHPGSLNNCAAQPRNSLLRHNNGSLASQQRKHNPQCVGKTAILMSP